MTSPPRPSPPYFLIGLFSWPLLRTVFRFRARGTEHLPRSGGYVLAAGHLSNLDPWAIGVPLWPQRFLRFMAKSELFWWPLGPFIRSCGAFKVRRGKADQDAIQTAVDLARAGHVIAMFPEGTRRKKGLLKTRKPQSHTGAARIAIEAGVPLIPAGIRGTDELRKLGAWRVVYGPPLETSDDPVETTERLMAAIRELEASL